MVNFKSHDDSKNSATLKKNVVTGKLISLDKKARTADISVEASYDTGSYYIDAETLIKRNEMPDPNVVDINTNPHHIKINLSLIVREADALFDYCEDKQYDDVNESYPF